MTLHIYQNYLLIVSKIFSGYEFTPLLYQRRKRICFLKIVICREHKSQKFVKDIVKNVLNWAILKKQFLVESCTTPTSKAILIKFRRCNIIFRECI